MRQRAIVAEQRGVECRLGGALSAILPTSTAGTKEAAALAALEDGLEVVESHLDETWRAVEHGDGGSGARKEAVCLFEDGAHTTVGGEESLHHIILKAEENM